MYLWGASQEFTPSDGFAEADAADASVIDIPIGSVVSRNFRVCNTGRHLYYRRDW